MEFIEVLSGDTNRFDKGYPMNANDTKALRDAIVYILNRIKSLEARLSPAVAEEKTDEPETKPRKSKKSA
jgi:hypothetical protein